MSIHTIMNTTTVTAMTTITTMDMNTTTAVTMDTSIHMIMVMNTATTTGMNMGPAVAATNLTTTTSMNLYTTTRPIHMKRIWPVIRTTANVLPAIPMKSIAITAAKAWPTANAVCRMPTT